MTALTNHGLALKLAVEHASANDYDYLDADDADLRPVFALAEKFRAYLDGETPAATTTETAAPETQRGASDAVDAINTRVQEQAIQLGDDVVTAVQGELERLRSQPSFNDVITRAQRAIDSQVTYLGRPAADRLRRIVRSVS